jgi:hypothetical protein
MMMTKTRDTTHGQTWVGGRQWRRLRVSLRVFRHTSHLPDRWVIQPEVIYARKRQ